MSRTKFYGWTMVVVLWLVYFINISFPYYGAGVINAYMAEALGMDRSTLGLGFTFILLCTGIPGPLVAYCVKKTGIRLTIALGSLILIGGSVLMAVAISKSWQYIVVFGIIIGLGCAFGGSIPIQTGITNWFMKRRAFAMSIVLTAAGIGGFIAAPILDRLIVVFSGNWRYAWLFVAGTCVLSGLLAIFFIKDKPADLGQVPDGKSGNEKPALNDNPMHRKRKTDPVFRTMESWRVGDAMKTSAFWFIMLGAVVYTGPVVMFIAHSVIHLKDLGHAPPDAAMSLGLLTISSIAGRLLAGGLADRIEPRYVWSIALLLLTAGILVIVKASSLIEVYVYAVLMGTGYGCAYICWVTIISNYFGADSFASIMGIMMPITTAAASIAPFLTGLAYDMQKSYAIAFYVAAVMSLLGALVVFFAKPPRLLKVSPAK